MTDILFSHEIWRNIVGYNGKYQVSNMGFEQVTIKDNLNYGTLQDRKSRNIKSSYKRKKIFY